MTLNAQPLMPGETFTGTVAKISAIERLSAADKLGLISGDIILKLGNHEPLEGVEDPTLLDRLTGNDWITLSRGSVVFRINVAINASGMKLEPFDLQKPMSVSAEGSWRIRQSMIRPGHALLLLPEHIPAFWWLVPAIAYGYFRIWQMMAGTILLYGVGLAMGIIPFLVTYATSVIIIALGGPNLLRDAAGKDGYMPRARVAISQLSDIPALEIMSGALLREERAKVMASRNSPTLRD